MASLSALASIFDSQGPGQFNLASSAVDSGLAARQSDRAAQYGVSDFNNRFLPDMLSAQGARGAYGSSATLRKATRGGEDLARGLVDLGSQGGSAHARTAVNSLLAQTGIQV